LAALVILVLGLAGAAVAGTLDDIAGRGELIVACQTQGPPFSFVDKNQKRSGSSIDFCELMAKDMGVKVKFLDFDWDGLIPALLSKKADVLAADMTPTLKRAMKVAFSEPYYYTGSVIVTKKDSAIAKPADLNSDKVTIAVLLGSTGEIVAKAMFPKAQIKSYKGGGPLLLNAIKDGHAQAAINDETAIVGQMADFPAGTFKLLPDILRKEPLSFAVRYDSMDLLSWINLFFMHTKLDGRYDKNINYWVKSFDWKKDH
jgi:polar amino acid transport system substrate-binding protein